MAAAPHSLFPEDETALIAQFTSSLLHLRLFRSSSSTVSHAFESKSFVFRNAFSFPLIYVPIEKPTVSFSDVSSEMFGPILVADHEIVHLTIFSGGTD